MYNIVATNIFKDSQIRMKIYWSFKLPFMLIMTTIMKHATLPSLCRQQKVINVYRPQRSCQGFVFTPVCLSTGGVVCLSACWDTTPWEQAPPREQAPPQSRHTLPEQAPPWEQAHPPRSRHSPSRRLLLWTVRILLECILVSQVSLSTGESPSRGDPPWTGETPGQRTPRMSMGLDRKLYPFGRRPPPQWTQGRPPGERPPKGTWDQTESDIIHPLVLTYSGVHCSGRYVSYWNAFLLIMYE